jgi:hypothetical protein
MIVAAERECPSYPIRQFCVGGGTRTPICRTHAQGVGSCVGRYRASTARRRELAGGSSYWVTLTHLREGFVPVTVIHFDRRSSVPGLRTPWASQTRLRA